MSEDPQQPVDERDPAAPRVGVDEWVAAHEQRREHRAGWWARLDEAWHGLPGWAQLAIVVVPAAVFPFTTGSDYLIRVDRLPCAQDQVLQPGSRVSITPTKVNGALAA